MTDLSLEDARGDLLRFITEAVGGRIGYTAPGAIKGFVDRHQVAASADAEVRHKTTLREIAVIAKHRVFSRGDGPIVSLREIERIANAALADPPQEQETSDEHESGPYLGHRPRNRG